MMRHIAHLGPLLGPTGRKRGLADCWECRYILGALQDAPVAQLDRAFDYETGPARRINPEPIRNQSITLTLFGG